MAFCLYRTADSTGARRALHEASTVRGFFAVNPRNSAQRVGNDDRRKHEAFAMVCKAAKSCAKSSSSIRDPCLVGFAASSILTIPTSEKQFHEGKTCIFPPNAFANDYATKRKNAQSICQVRVKCSRARTRDSCDERPIR